MGVIVVYFPNNDACIASSFRANMIGFSMLALAICLFGPICQCRWRQIDVLVFVVEISRGDRNDISRGNPSLGCLSGSSILVVLELHHNLLDARKSMVQLPNRRLGHLGLVKTGGFWEDGHAVCPFEKASLGARRQSHHMTPGQTDQLGSIVLVLHIVGFCVHIKSLNRRQNPGTVLVCPGDLGSNLLAGAGGPFGALAVACPRGRDGGSPIQIHLVLLSILTLLSGLGLSIGAVPIVVDLDGVSLGLARIFRGDGWALFQAL